MGRVYRSIACLFLVNRLLFAACVLLSFYNVSPVFIRRACQSVSVRKLAPYDLRQRCQVYLDCAKVAGCPSA